jgi:hypothetical protein
MNCNSSRFGNNSFKKDFYCGGTRMKIAVLDDYQQVAFEMADWSALRQDRGCRQFCSTDIGGGCSGGACDL